MLINDAGPMTAEVTASLGQILLSKRRRSGGNIAKFSMPYLQVRTVRPMARTIGIADQACMPVKTSIPVPSIAPHGAQASSMFSEMPEIFSIGPAQLAHDNAAPAQIYQAQNECLICRSIAMTPPMYIDVLRCGLSRDGPNPNSASAAIPKVWIMVGLRKEAANRAG
ncbi:hypothetical protein H8B02_44855 [Bradyrhizobium sp. Pear77]|uniref:hypothetical protein n=1 Tax=Bradyrhizobium TaxID=374 RepID=UPI001E291CFE|nr:MULTISPECIES: hypothetical protein [Bradyrhizobium]MCC8960283.1 hypothetical protein [Bradyrhizobium altum]MCC8968240.1 hypothetical protein [Bradyrhizobium oropedii]